MKQDQEVQVLEANPSLPLIGKVGSRPAVTATIRSIDSLTAPETERLYSLMQLYYENVDFEQFRTDLVEKDHVILLRDKDSKIIQGFSTLLKIPLVVNGQKVIGVYSGDTVLNKSYWGNAALGRSFLRYLWQLKATNLGTPIYWFLISKGYKTYLLMANNFKTHYPRFEKPTPLHHQEIMDAFYGKRFGDNYQAKNDLIHFDKPSCHLRDNIAPISEKSLLLPRVRFFQAKNPLWAQGDELTCIAEMTLLAPLVYSVRKLVQSWFR